MEPAANFKIWCEQRVVLANISGSWDTLSAKDYASEFKAIAKPLIGSDWAHIVYLDDWQLGVPEIEPIVAELVAWCLDNGLRYTAQVYCPNMVKRYQLDRMIVDSSKWFEKRVYPNEQQALTWLASLGFTVNSTTLQQTG